MMISDALSRAPIDEDIDVDSVYKYKETATEKMIANSIMNQDAEKYFIEQKLNNLLQKANNDQDYIALRSSECSGSWFPTKMEYIGTKS